MRNDPVGRLASPDEQPATRVSRGAFLATTGAGLATAATATATAAAAAQNEKKAVAAAAKYAWQRTPVFFHERLDKKGCKEE